MTMQSRSKRMQLPFLGWPIVQLSQMTTETVAILNLSSPDVTLVKRRHSNDTLVNSSKNDELFHVN